MDSLDYKHHEPLQLDVEYDYNLQSPTEPNLETSTQSTSEELDQELENLLLLMGEKDSCTPIQTELINDDNLVEPTIEEIEWLNPNDLVDSKEFNYQPTPTNRSQSHQVPASNNDRFSYQARYDSSNSNYSPSRQADNKFDYQPNTSQTTGNCYSYSPSERNNYNYQASHSSSKFDYQSNQDSNSYSYKPNQAESKFNRVPTTHNNHFDYTPTTPTKFDTQSPSSKNYPPIPNVQNNSGLSNSNGGVLEVEVDQNTTVRLEVGASVSVGDGWSTASSYAKATIYRRG